MKPRSIFIRRCELPSRISLNLPAISLAAVLAAATGSAGASSLAWDGNGSTAPNPAGGPGNWDTDTTSNWWDGASNVKWPATSTGDDDASFGSITGGATITIVSPVTANDLTFNSTYTLSGANTITLDGTTTPTITTPTISVGPGLSATFGNNTATVLAGSAGLTKARPGTVTLNGSAVNTLTGGVTVKGGTLALNLSNMGTPTNLLNSGNALILYHGGTFSVTGKTGAFTSAQEVNGTTVYAGNSNLQVYGGGGTSTTLTLGTLTQAEIGAVVSMAAPDLSTQVPNAGSQAVKASGTGGSFIAPWAVVGVSTAGTARWAYLLTSGQVTSQAGVSPGISMVDVTDPAKVYTLAGSYTLATADKTAFALQDNDTANNSVTLGNFNITTNGLSQLRTTYTRSFLQGTGTGKIIVGASNELVAMASGNLTIAVPIADKPSNNSNVTYAGGGLFKLSATNTFSGQLTVNSGTVQVDTNGSVNSASGIKINGGKLLQTNIATAISPVVTVQGGTIDGTGTINTVTVSDLAANKITNGNNTITPLTIGALTFNGDAAVDVRTAGSAGLTVSGALTTTPANGKVTINVPAALVWATGTTYNLIGYGSWAGSIGDFTLGTVAGLGGRQNAALGTTGATNGFITLSITGDSVVWTGGVNDKWTASAIGSPYNWQLQTAATGTEFQATDDVFFNDTATGLTTVDISDANVSPNTVTFDNSSKNYTITSSSTFGIAAGSLIKNGSGITTLESTNTYTGSTTINAGTLAVSGGNAIANSGLVSLADTAGANLDVTTSETIGALSGGGASGGAVSIPSGQTLTLASGTQTHAGTVGGAGVLVNAGAAQTLNGVVSPDGGLSVTSGRLTLGASNSYTGVTPVSAGAALIVTANNALGSTGAGNETTLAGTGTANSGALGLSGGITYSAAEKIIGSGVGNMAAVNGFTDAQRGIVQSVSGNNTFAGPIEINSAGFTRFGTQNGAQLTLSGPITLSSGVTGVSPLFRSGNNDGDFVTLTNTGNNWDLDTLVYSGGTTGNSGLKLGADNALPTGVSVTGAVASQAATTFDMAGYDQTLNGLVQIVQPNQTYQFKIINSNGSESSTLTLDLTADRASTSTTLSNGAGVLNLVKQGSFKQTLGGTHTYTGTTTVSAGTLALDATGTIDNSPTLAIAAGAVLDTSAKTSHALPATVTIGLDGNTDTSGLIDATGKELLISGAAVTFNETGSLTASEYVLANYATLGATAAFASVESVPGYILVYDHNGGTQIALVKTSSTVDYATWGGPYGLTNGSEGGDLDNDGLTNFDEYAFGLIPNNGSSVNPITAPLDKTTGQFTYQRLAGTGLTCAIWTSDNLSTWTKDTAAGQSATPAGANESVVVTLSATPKPLTASKFFVRVIAE